MTTLVEVEWNPQVGGWASVRCAYNEAIVERLKNMPGCSWNRSKREWYGPAEAITEVVEVIKRANLGVVSMDDPPKYELPHMPDERWADIYAYQRTGVRFLVSSIATYGGALLADDMGLGKSVQTIKAMEEYNSDEPRRFLVLCPAVAVANWANELAKWSNFGEPVRLGVTRKKQRIVTWEPGQVAICSYDTFRSLWRGKSTQALLQENLADMIVLDEAHYLSSPKAQRSVAVREYTQTCRLQHATALIALTGTPVMARPRDLWHPLDLVYPGRFGSKFHFERRYCDGRWVEIQGLEKSVWEADGHSHLDELGRRLQNGLMLRRVKSEVLELPERQRIMLPVEMPASAKRAMSKALVELRADRDVGRVLSTIEAYKLDAAAELAKDAMTQGKRPLLFTLRRDSAHQLGERLGAPVVTGAVDANDRFALLDGAPCGVATVYSVTTAINLTSYDTVIFVGLDWVPATLLQAEARIHRIGQHKSVTCYYMIGLGTVDELVRDKVLQRLESFQTIVGNAPDEGELESTLRGNKSEQELLDEILASVLGS